MALKDDFPVLKDDMCHLKWKPEFLAELKVQKMERLASHKFDPDDARDSYDRELCKQQNDHFWTVLLCVFDNDMGRMCIDATMATRNAREACLQHEDMQEASHRQRHTSGELLEELVDFHPDDFNWSSQCQIPRMAVCER